jgi:hypothetical protein
MYAFGDSYLFIAVFGVLALVPTGALLYYLRPYRRFWVVLAGFGLVLAIAELTVVAYAAFVWLLPLLAGA